MKYKPPIVVVGYDRPGSMERILGSLKGLKNISGVKLIISIDNKAPDNHPVRDIAEAYQWPFGEKEVIYQPESLGLRKHILQCAGFSQEYGSVIILEDDLFVSPYMYEYAVQALEYYGDDAKIGGISLYNQPVQEIAQYPFFPINDDSDVHFMQFPSSLGQTWTRDQWAEFKSWYDTDPDLDIIALPNYIRNWPVTSWKKYFCAFLVLRDKYFVFPGISFTTNFNDPGSNLKRRVNHEGQTMLRLFGQPYRFRSFVDSQVKYDVYLELDTATVKQFNPALSSYDFELDLYGTKDMENVKTPLVITSRPARNAIRGFRRAMKPHDMNIIFDLEGDELILCKKEDVVADRNIHVRRVSNYKYNYTRNILGLKTHMYNYYLKFLKRR
ncbi:MAG: glycosyl transferase family 2 [Bacteroidetes bacterium]|nr:glycosyl transferase family 2 [Bacteroidota bacterium]